MTTPRLTLKLAKRFVAVLGGRIKHDTEWQEYVLHFTGMDYHTDSLEDVIGTARAYCGTHHDIDWAEAILRGEC